MRQLRSSLVSESMSSSTGILDQTRGSSSRAIRHSEAVTAYNVAPKQRLILVDDNPGSKNNTASIRSRYKYLENSKDRKRRLWKENKKKWAEQSKELRTHFGGWTYLPDLILEHIFKFLSYRVGLFSQLLFDIIVIIATSNILKERLNAALSCGMWQRVFWNTSIWSHLVVKGDTLCQYRYVTAIRGYEVDTL